MFHFTKYFLEIFVHGISFTCPFSFNFPHHADTHVAHSRTAIPPAAKSGDCSCNYLCSYAPHYIYIYTLLHVCHQSVPGRVRRSVMRRDEFRIDRPTDRRTFTYDLYTIYKLSPDRWWRVCHLDDGTDNACPPPMWCVCLGFNSSTIYHRPK